VQFNSFARTLRRSSAELTRSGGMLLLTPPCFRARSLSVQPVFSLGGLWINAIGFWMVFNTTKGEQLENFTHEKQIR
jgi:hypothetical protein